MAQQGKHQQLIRAARAQARLKGHVLGEFIVTRIDTGQPTVVSLGAMTATCKKCGAYVGLDPAPPTGISKIWGDALERDCLVERELDSRKKEAGPVYKGPAVEGENTY